MVRTALGKQPKHSHNSTKNNNDPHSNQGNCMSPVSSLSLGGSPTTNAVSNIPNTREVRNAESSSEKHVNSQRRPMVEGISSYNSRKKPRYRSNQAKKRMSALRKNYG